MFKKLFTKLTIARKGWISQSVIDYLATIPTLFRVFYTINLNGNNFRVPLRDENGKFFDFNKYETDPVVGIGIQYQEDGFSDTYYFDGIVGDDNIPFMRDKFNTFIDKYPKTASTLAAAKLYNMQHELRKAIEKVTGAVGAYDGKNIVYSLSDIKPELRDSILETIRRFDKDCVHPMLMIAVGGSTDEQIGATMNELALIETERECAATEEEI